MSKCILVAAVLLASMTAASAQSTEDEGNVRFLTLVPAETNSIADYYQKTVYTAADERIGTVDDILVRHDGYIPAAIISVGGFLGIPSKSVAVPFAAIQVTLKENKPYLVLDTTKLAVKRAPGFKYNRTTKQWERVEELP